MAPEQARGQAGRQARRHLGLRRRPLRNADGRACSAATTSQTSSLPCCARRSTGHHVPAETPPRLRRLLERCLERDARTRLRDIGEARVEIAKIESGDTGGFAGRRLIGGDTHRWLAQPSGLDHVRRPRDRPGGCGLDALDRSQPQFVASRSPGAPGVRSAIQPVVRRWHGGLDSRIPGRPAAGVHRAIPGRPTPVVDAGAGFRRVEGVGGNRRSPHAVLVARQPIDRVRVEGETQAH